MKYNFSNWNNYKDTLCWHCANAVPNRAGTRGCSWSKKFIPVEGWEALKTNVFASNGKNKTRVTQSYIVKSCPEVIPDGRQGEK